jgi:hypothetical protein
MTGAGFNRGMGIQHIWSGRQVRRFSEGRAAREAHHGDDDSRHDNMT